MIEVIVIKELGSIKWFDRSYKIHLVINWPRNLCSFDLLNREAASPCESFPVF
jgi:hypothetical protein